MIVRKQRILSAILALLLTTALFAHPTYASASIGLSSAPDPSGVNIITSPVEANNSDEVYLEINSQQGNDNVRYRISDPTQPVTQFLKFEVNQEIESDRLKVRPSDTLTASITVNNVVYATSQFPFSVPNNPGIDVSVINGEKTSVTVSVYKQGTRVGTPVIINSSDYNSNNQKGLFVAVPFEGTYQVVAESATERLEQTTNVTVTATVNNSTISYASAKNGCAAFAMGGTASNSTCTAPGGNSGGNTPPHQVSVSSNVYVYDENTPAKWVIPSGVVPNVHFNTDGQGNIPASELLQIQLKSNNLQSDITMPVAYKNSIFKIVMDLTGFSFEPVVLIGRKFDTTFDTQDGMKNGWSYDDQTKKLTVYAKPSSFAVADGGDIAKHAHEGSILLAAGSFGSLSGAERDQMVAINRGLTLTTNAESFGLPNYIKQPGARPQLQIFVQGPHYMMDGQTLNEGFFQAYLPSMLLADWSINTSGQLLASIGEGSENRNSHEVMFQAEGNRNTGITLLMNNFTYSPHTISISSAPELLIVPVTGVALNKSKLSLEVGASEKLIATVSPSDATEKRLNWSSDKTSVATVDSEGTVTAVSAGSATISVTTVDGTRIATATISITNPTISNPGETDKRDADNTGGTPTTSIPSLPAQEKPENVIVPASDGVKLGERASTTVRESTANGIAVAKVTLDEAKLAEAFKLLKDDAKTITVEVKQTEPITKVQLPAAILANAKSSSSDAIVAIQSESAAYMLPVKSLDLDKLAKELGADLKDIQVQVIIEKLSDEKAAQMKSQAKSNGISLVAEPIDFSVMVEANGKVVEVSNFGGNYISRSIKLNSSTDTKKAAGVMFDPATGEYAFVPTTFVTENGKTVAIMKRPGNSIYTVVQYEKNFDDVVGHWAKADIERLASNFLVKGRTPTEFYPEASITRAEFAAMLVRSLGLTEVNGTTTVFNDVQSSAWFASPVATAAAYGLIDGMSEGVFAPDAPVTREQLAVMITRALKVAGKPAVGETQQLARFVDGSDVHGYAKEAMATSIVSGIMNGVNGNRLEPDRLATRAEAAVMVKRMLQFSDFIN